VALLRGINVGKAKRVAMADLRKVVVGLGYGDVRTLLNSGNVVFEMSKPDDAAGRIEKAIAARLGLASRVTVLMGTEVAAAVKENPLAAIADHPSRLLIVVPRTPGALARLKPLLDESWAPEVLAIGKRFAYVWCGDGIAAGRLWLAVDRLLGDEGTARNMGTMTKLLAMVEGPRSTVAPGKQATRRR
jgi:uncharacterized protein (DUF1697 family)